MLTKLTNIDVGKVKYLTLGKLLFGPCECLCRALLALVGRTFDVCTCSVCGFVILEMNVYTRLYLIAFMNACQGLLYSGHLVGCLMWFVGSDEYARVKPGSWSHAAGLADASGVTQYV